MSNSIVFTDYVCIGGWGKSLPNIHGDLHNDKKDFISNIPKVPGFILSDFPIMVNYAVEKIKRPIFGGDDTALILGSFYGDVDTEDAVTRKNVENKSINPLLFAQSIPNSIFGYIAKEYNITGTMSSISNGGNLSGDLLEMATVLLNSGDANQVIIIGVEIVNSRNLKDKTSGNTNLLEPVAVALVLEKHYDSRAIGYLNKQYSNLTNKPQKIEELLNGEFDLLYSNPNLFYNLPSWDRQECTPFINIEKNRNFGALKGVLDIAFALNQLEREQASKIIGIDFGIGGEVNGWEIIK